MAILFLFQSCPLVLFLFPNRIREQFSKPPKKHIENGIWLMRSIFTYRNTVNIILIVEFQEVQVWFIRPMLLVVDEIKILHFSSNKRCEKCWKVFIFIHFNNIHPIRVKMQFKLQPRNSNLMLYLNFLKFFAFFEIKYGR